MSGMMQRMPIKVGMVLVAGLPMDLSLLTRDSGYRIRMHLALLQLVKVTKRVKQAPYTAYQIFRSQVALFLMRVPLSLVTKHLCLSKAKEKLA